MINTMPKEETAIIYETEQDALNAISDEPEQDIKVEQVYMIKHMYLCGLKLNTMDLYHCADWVMRKRVPVLS